MGHWRERAAGRARLQLAERRGGKDHGMPQAIGGLAGDGESPRIVEEREQVVEVVIGVALLQQDVVRSGRVDPFFEFTSIPAAAGVLEHQQSLAIAAG